MKRSIYPLDPLTHQYRIREYQRESKKMDLIGQYRPGFNLIYWKRIVRVPIIVDRISSRANWSSEKTILTKALLTSRMGARYVDHIIHRIKQTESLSEAQEHYLWEIYHSDFLDRYRNDQRIPDRENIIKVINRIHNYVMPPKRLIQERAHHWRRIANILTKGKNLESYLPERIKKILNSNLSKKVKAFKICFTVGLCADIEERWHHQAWTYAYREMMLRFYESIGTHPEALHAIIELD